MNDLSSPITIHTKVDGHTYVSELSEDEVQMLAIALSLVNSQMHGRMAKSVECIARLDAHNHEDWHVFLDKIHTVLHPLIGKEDQSSDPTPGDEWKNTA